MAGSGRRVRVAASSAGDPWACSPRSCRAGSAAVCRELTKRFEEVVRGPLEELAARFAEPPRGEITLVLAPATDVRDGALRRRRASRGRRAGRRRSVTAHGGGRRLEADRHAEERALPRLSVTRRSICVAALVRRALPSLSCSLFGQRDWLVCVAGALLWALAAGPSAFAWAWPADGPVLREFSVGGRQVRGRPASRNRHRGRQCARDTGTGRRRGHVRRPGADARLHRDDRDRRAQGVARPTSARFASAAGERRERGRSDRRSRPLRRPGARRSVRPPGHPGRR